MADLRPFDEDARCPKCGGGTISTTFHEDKYVTPLHGCYIECEHLHRTCNRCRHNWAEAPLDSIREQETP